MTGNAFKVDYGYFVERLIHPGGPFYAGLAITVGVAVVAQSAGVGLGLVSALCRRSGVLPARLLSQAYTLGFRGTPIIVQIFFVYFGANILFGFDLFPNTMSFGLFSLSGAVVAGTITLTLNEGAYMSEIIRAAVDAIDDGQMESSLSLGMTPGLAMRRIILPQAWRIILPTLGNQFNGMIKTTSLLAFIGVYEIFLDAQTNYSATFKPVENFAAVAAWYLLLTTVWTLVQRVLERRLNRADTEVVHRLDLSPEAAEAR